MTLAYLYTKSELTPWKENVNLYTLQFLLSNTPVHHKAKIVHFDGFTREVFDKLRQFDVVFNLCYGYEHSDQVVVAEWLELHNILHTASSMENMAVAQNKALLPLISARLDIPTPELWYTCQELDKNNLYISKPRRGSCHRNITIATGEWMKIHLHQNDDDLIIQPYIKGREFSVGVIPAENGSSYFALPPVEIIPAENQEVYIAGNSFGKTRREMNPNLSNHDLYRLMSYAEDLHKHIGLRGMSRSDFRMSEQGDIYILDVNAMPNLDPNKSLMPALCLHHGISISSLISRIINNAIFFADYIEEKVGFEIVNNRMSDHVIQ